MSNNFIRRLSIIGAYFSARIECKSAFLSDLSDDPHANGIVDYLLAYRNTQPLTSVRDIFFG